MIDSLQRREWRDFARKDLIRYKNAHIAINRYLARIDTLRAKAEQFTRPLDPDNVQVQAANNGPEDIMCKLVDMQQELRRMQRERENLYMELAENISEVLLVQHQTILRHHWLHGRALYDIAKALKLSYDWTRHQHRIALEEYGKSHNTIR